MYQTALRLRREHPALGAGYMRWLDTEDGALVFARDPGFVFAANLAAAPLRLPPHQEVILASGPLRENGSLPRDTAVWLQV
jgi:alpha-glucosidase